MIGYQVLEAVQQHDAVFNPLQEVADQDGQIDEGVDSRLALYSLRTQPDYRRSLQSMSSFDLGGMLASYA